MVGSGFGDAVAGFVNGAGGMSFIFSACACALKTELQSLAQCPVILQIWHTARCPFQYTMVSLPRMSGTEFIISRVHSGIKSSASHLRVHSLTSGSLPVGSRM